jgi:hypothetical protein
VFEGLRGGREFSEEAVGLGEAFLLLQRLRHGVDYDPGYRVSRSEALELIERARQAIGLIPHLEPEERKLLAARLIGRTRS